MKNNRVSAGYVQTDAEEREADAFRLKVIRLPAEKEELKSSTYIHSCRIKAVKQGKVSRTLVVIL